MRVHTMPAQHVLYHDVPSSLWVVLPIIVAIEARSGWARRL
jgi:hypothetical protein